jgi:hypothetical protein
MSENDNNGELTPGAKRGTRRPQMIHTTCTRWENTKSTTISNVREGGNSTSKMLTMVS